MQKHFIHALSVSSTAPHGDPLLDLQRHRVQLLNIVSVTEDEGLGWVEAAGNDVLQHGNG